MRHPCPVRVWVTWCGLFELCTLSHVFLFEQRTIGNNNQNLGVCASHGLAPYVHGVGTFGVHAEFTSLNRKKSKPDVCYSGFSGPLLGRGFRFAFPVALAISATAVVITVPVRGVVWAFWKGLSV
jgi:hypothetical protein